MASGRFSMRVMVSLAARISAPWPPTAGKINGANSMSRSRIGRPLTSANAPPVRSNRRFSDSFNAAETSTSKGDGPMSISVPSTSSRSAIERGSRAVNMSKAERLPASFIIVCVTIILPSFEINAARLMRRDFNVAIDAGHHFEFALVNLAFIAGDGAIFAFRQHHARERADRFLDHVAAGREHRPGRVGERLAALLVDQLERDDGGAMIDGNVGELAGLYADIGTHQRIGVAVIRDDVISAFRNDDHRASHHMLGDRAAVTGFELAAFIDVE